MIKNCRAFGKNNNNEFRSIVQLLHFENLNPIYEQLAEYNWGE